METSKVKAGVAGVGSIGQNHARIYSQLDAAELTAVYDTDLDRAREITEKYGGKPAASLEEFGSLVDAASVAVPTSAHREVGAALLEAGCHVLVEKPIADNVDDARFLIDLARRHNRTLQVGHIERFNPVMSQLEKRLDSPKFIESHRLSPFPKRSLDIGVVLDLMIHDLDIILHLVRSPIESIDAVGVPVLTKREDIANARLRFENGCVANVTVSRISPEKMRKIRVFQSDAYLSLDYQEQGGWIYKKDGFDILREEVAVEKDEPLKLEIASFIDCVSRGDRPKVSGDHGAAALDVALEITGLIENGLVKG